MLLPRYLFVDDFKEFYTYLLTKPHKIRIFKRNDYLWKANTFIEKIHYIITGIAQNYVEHENGNKRIISFHGAGTLFPGFHRHHFKIENAIITKAITEMKVLEFDKNTIEKLIKENTEFNFKLIDWYASYVNLLLYENAHQEYNTSFMKLCNLLYLLNNNTLQQWKMTQEDLAEILGMSRINLTRSIAKLKQAQIIHTYRKEIKIMDKEKLKTYCSMETI